jgi:hypothetical protein
MASRAARVAWQSRLPGLLYAMEVFSATRAAGLHEPQMVPAHKIAALSARVMRLGAGRRSPESPQPRQPSFEPQRQPMQKWVGPAIQAASAFVLPAIADSEVGRRGVAWIGRRASQGMRWAARQFTSPKTAGRVGAASRKSLKTIGGYVRDNRAGFAGSLGFSAGGAWATPDDEPASPPKQTREAPPPPDALTSRRRDSYR